MLFPLREQRVVHTTTQGIDLLEVPRMAPAGVRGNPYRSCHLGSRLRIYNGTSPDSSRTDGRDPLRNAAHSSLLGVAQAPRLVTEIHTQAIQQTEE